MRSLVILCLVGVAAAAYEYNPGQIEPRNTNPAASEYNKEFYTYTAPENEFSDDGRHADIANSLKKNLRVIFIKGPENQGLENALLQLAKSTSDDRTAIYVLNKQADISELANKLNSLQNTNAHKPEVHFVKYRTQADAENAQRTIQQQYDSLPGSSTNNHGGHAPVLDFVSKTPSNRYVPPAPAVEQPEVKYLPPGRLV